MNHTTNTLKLISIGCHGKLLIAVILHSKSFLVSLVFSKFELSENVIDSNIARRLTSPKASDEDFNTRVAK